MTLPRRLLLRIRRKLRRQLMHPVFIHGHRHSRTSPPEPEEDIPVKPIPGPLFYLIIFALSLLAPVAFYIAQRLDAAHERAQLPAPPDDDKP